MDLSFHTVGNRPAVLHLRDTDFSGLGGDGGSLAFQIANGKLYAGEQVLEKNRIPVSRGVMAERSVKDTAFNIGPNPGDCVVFVGPFLRIFHSAQVEA